ncbi:MAG: hypothetical protein WBK46_04480, partial [Ruminococcus flavefaciens]
YRAHLKEMKNSYFTCVRPIMGKNSIKSLWKGGTGEEPFLRKVLPPINAYKASVRVPRLIPSSFFTI